MNIWVLLHRSTPFTCPAAACCPTSHPQLEAQLGIHSCPHCNEGILPTPGIDLLSALCPTCDQPLHVEDAAADAAFDSFRRRQGWPNCPSCGAAVEKTEGCNHMRCRCAGMGGVALVNEG